MSQQHNSTPAGTDTRSPTDVSAPVTPLFQLDATLRMLAEALSLLPIQGFSFVGAQHAAGVKPRQAATLATLGESVVGPDSNPPQVSQKELTTLQSQLDALVAAGVLESRGTQWRMREGARQQLGDFARTPHAQNIARGFVDWLQPRLHDGPALLEEEASWRQAMALALECGDWESFAFMAGWMGGPGGFYQQRRDLKTGAALIAQALETMGDRQDALAAWMLFLQAGLLRSQGKLDDAYNLLERSSSIAEATQALREVGMARGEMAAIRMQQLRFDEAIPLLHEKMAALQTAHDPAEFANTCGELAEVLVVQGQYDDALDLLEQRLGLQQAMKDTRGAAMTRVTLGDVLADMQRFQEAVANYELALPVLETLDPPNAAVGRANLAIYQMRIGDKAGALENFQRARTVFLQYRLRDEVAMVEGYLQDLARGE